MRAWAHRNRPRPSSARVPPGEHDRILLFRDAAGPMAASLPVEGAVRALASRRHGANAYLAAALEDAGGGFRVALFEMAPRK